MLDFLWDSIKEGSNEWIAITASILIFTSAFGWLIKKGFPNIPIDISQRSARIILLITGVFLLFITLSIGTYGIYSDKEEDNAELAAKNEQLQEELESASKAKFASIQEMRQSYHEGQYISIGDMVFVRDSSVIDGDTFKNCHIYGPSLIKVGGVGMISNCGFDGDLETVFVVTTNERVTGAIQFTNCNFIDCVFHRVGFIDTEENIRILKQKFTEGMD